jgi:transposase
VGSLCRLGTRDEHTHAEIVYDLFHIAHKITDAVIKTITSYLDGIVNHFKHRLTNAASEAFNTKPRSTSSNGGRTGSIISSISG